MSNQSEPMYVQPNGETIPVSELVYTDNIEKTGTDWFVQDGIYKRHMSLSYLPNDVSVADLRALAHADGVEKYSSTISNRPNETHSEQTSLLAAKKSTLIQFLKNSKIYKLARSKIVSNLADEATERSHENTLNASIFFRIEADSKVDLDTYTENVKQKAKEIGAEVISVEESPEIAISAMDPFGRPSNEIGDEYCITIDAAEFAMIKSLEVPQELLDDLYDDDREPIYQLS